MKHWFFSKASWKWLNLGHTLYLIHVFILQKQDNRNDNNDDNNNDNDNNDDNNNDNNYYDNGYKQWLWWF